LQHRWLKSSTYTHSRISGIVVSFGCLLLVWFLVTSVAHLVDPVILPAPQKVIKAGFKLFTNDRLLADSFVTLRRLGVSLLLSVAIGLPAGLLLGYNAKLYRNVEGVFHALRSVPATALFPLLLIVVGVGESSIVFVATYPGLLIILINAASGAIMADPRRVRQAETLGMSGWQITTRVLFYESLPLVLGALRTVVSYALVLVIAVEMFIGVGEDGLGRRIFDLQSSFRVPEAYAVILLTAIVGIFLNLVVTMLEAYLLRWQTEGQNKT
jgi:ABC-type nitrate/sulfonate/bicarbonate transport system permease component